MFFPAYWVHANFFRFVGGGEIISHTTTPDDLNVLVSRRVITDEAQVVFWTVNREASPLSDIAFTLYNFPASQATLHVYDNLTASMPLVTETLHGDLLVFTTTLPALSSRAFVLSSDALTLSLDHVLLAPDWATRTVGQVISYTLTAYDTLGQNWDVTETGLYTAEPGAGGFWDGSRYTTEMSGVWTVTGTYQAQADTAALTVWQPSDRLYLPLILRRWSQDV